MNYTFTGQENEFLNLTKKMRDRIFARAKASKGNPTVKVNVRSGDKVTTGEDGRIKVTGNSRPIKKTPMPFKLTARAKALARAKARATAQARARGEARARETAKKYDMSIINKRETARALAEAKAMADAQALVVDPLLDPVVDANITVDSSPTPLQDKKVLDVLVEEAEIEELLDADSGVVMPTEANILPKSMFQKYKLPILIGGGLLGGLVVLKYIIK